MARKLRVEFEGAVYHVMCRGDRRENIFEDDVDRERFIQTLAACCKRTGWRIHAFVLMSNHYHWLIETPHANLVAGMRWFQTTYTVRYNLRHRKSGHLFSGRYKAVLVDPESKGYFAAVADYIHLNPARAGLIVLEGKLSDYRWSSLPLYLGAPGKRPHWLETLLVLGELGLADGAADRRRYGLRMEERARESEDQDQLKTMRKGWLLGGETFRDRILDWMEQRAGKAGAKVRREHADQEHGQRHAERLIAESLRALEMEEEELLPLCKGNWRKRVIAHRVREQTSVSLRWLGARLQMGSEGHVSRVSASLEDIATTAEYRSYEKQLHRNARKKD